MADDHEQTQGLYSARSSIFSMADKHHLMRLVDLSGYSKSAKGQPFVLNDETRRNLSQLDYHLFQEGLPEYLDRTKRYDRMPNDPLDRLFAALPTPEEDDGGFPPKAKEAIDAHNRRIVEAIWRVIEFSSDPNAHDYWWLCRFAFSLWQRSDLSIRCVFTQLLGQLAASGAVPVAPAPTPAPDMDATNTFPIPGSYPQSSSSAEASETAEEVEPSSSTRAAGGPSSSSREAPKIDPVDPSANKQAWFRYTRWVHEGRRDEDSELHERKRAAEEKGDALGLNTCAFCRAPRGFCGLRESCSGNKMFYCSGCYLPSLPHLKRVYCSKNCQLADWAGNHYYDCQKRKHFLRAADLLHRVANEYQTITYSNFAESLDTNKFSGDESGEAGKAASRTFISPAAWSRGPWVGDPVFVEPKNTLLKIKGPEMVPKLLNWDSGDNLYYHLQDIIQSILGPHCEVIVEMNVFVRNARGDLTVGASDINRERDEYQVSKGKNPMFWPHPVLTCRLQNAKTPDTVYVLDFLGKNFDFDHFILPFDAFIKMHHVSRVSSEPLLGMLPHWYPRSQLGLIACRDYVARQWFDRTRPFFEEMFPQYEGPGQLTKLKDTAFKDKVEAYIDFTEHVLRASVQAVRNIGNYRLYLHHNPNPYGHEHTVGVTVTKDQVNLYSKIWISDAVYEIIIKSFHLENKKLAVGSETRRLVAMWIDRLLKHGQKHPYDAPELLGKHLAKHYNLSGNVTLEECGKMEATWLIWNGIPEEEFNNFYSFCHWMLESMHLSACVVHQTSGNFASPQAVIEHSPLDAVVRRRLKELPVGNKMGDLIGRQSGRAGEALTDMTIQELRRFVVIGSSATAHTAAHTKNEEKSSKGKMRSE